MGLYKPGDRIVCRLKNQTLVNALAPFDQELILEIVALEDSGYYLFVPPYLSINSSISLSARDATYMGINIRYVGEDIVYVSYDGIVKVSEILDGLACKRCQQFCQYAISNQEDNSFLCWLCRKYPYR